MPTMYKCKICGGSLEIHAEKTTATCEHCGTTQTLPRLTDDRRAQLYDRAGHFRRNKEFDKAMSIYENILNEDNTDAEAYWSIVLCRFGIDYVEDPATRRRLPTINRTQFTTIFDDEDYKSALRYADMAQRRIYEAEAAAINDIQKGILAISQKEEPFDVFICYKETDADGRRTPDSVLANDLYHQLVAEGFKVFFSRITLEDKLGTAYEPYIFAALNSAKVMVVLGTKPEYFNAVWVKNEWSRYLALVNRSAGKKMLIPAYRDMDPYDLPMEFSNLQAQDMSKLGFMQDLIRGIKKIVGVAPAGAPKAAPTEAPPAPASNQNALLERAFMALEDGEFARAHDFCEQVLNQDAHNAEAYLGQLMAEMKVRSRERLGDGLRLLDTSALYAKIMRFGDEALKAEMESYMACIRERQAEMEKKQIYDRAVGEMKSARGMNDLLEVAQVFEGLGGYRDSAALAKTCREKAFDSTYVRACNLETDGERAWEAKRFADAITQYGKAANLFQTITEWKDSAARLEKCRNQIEQIRQIKAAEETRIMQKRLEDEAAAQAAAKKRNKVLAIVAAAAAGLLVLVIVFCTVIWPQIQILQWRIEYTDQFGEDFLIATKEDMPYFTVTSDGRLTYDILYELPSHLEIPTLFEEIPVKTIGGSAFYGCSSLTSIKIPDSVTSIGDHAFKNCSSLTSITIPDSVTSIGDHAFENCSSLTSITIPDGVTSIGYSAFYDCPIEYATIPAHVISVIPQNSLHTVVITGATSIGNYAFSGWSSLTSITIPEGVTSIGASAFSGCGGLTSVIIPASVISIGKLAFRGCRSLTSITIPDGVTSIGESAFSVCDSLTSVTIPDSVTNIGDYAFFGCDSLTSVTFQGTKAQWKAISMSDNWDLASSITTVHCTDGAISV